MPGPEEIVRSLTGAWRLFLDRPDALRYFDFSVEGFWRSFGAIILIFPIYLAITLAEHNRILADPAGAIAFSGDIFLANKFLGLILDWITLPIVLAFAARPLGLASFYVPFVVARNWGTVLAVLPFGLIALLFLGGVISNEMSNILSLLLLIVIIRFGYLIARRAFGADIPTAIGIVIGDVIISLAIVGFLDAILPYGAIAP